MTLSLMACWRRDDCGLERWLSMESKTRCLSHGCTQLQSSYRSTMVSIVCQDNSHWWRSLSTPGRWLFENSKWNGCCSAMLQQFEGTKLVNLVWKDAGDRITKMGYNLLWGIESYSSLPNLFFEIYSFFWHQTICPWVCRYLSAPEARIGTVTAALYYYYY